MTTRQALQAVFGLVDQTQGLYAMPMLTDHGREVFALRSAVILGV